MILLDSLQEPYIIRALIILYHACQHTQEGVMGKKRKKSAVRIELHRQHILQQGVGAGTHTNAAFDVCKGRRRKPKHPKQCASMNAE